MPVKNFIEAMKLKYPDLPDEFIKGLETEYDQDESVWKRQVTTAEEAAKPIAEENGKLKDRLFDFMMNKSGEPIPGNNSSGGVVPPVAGENPNEYVPKGLMNAAFGGGNDKKE